MTGEMDHEIEIYTVTARELEASVDRAVRRAFADIGLHADTAEERQQIRADFQSLRRWRRATDEAALQVGRVVLLAMAGGLVAATWVGIKIHLLRQP